MLAGFAGALVEGRWTEDYSDSWADREILDGLHDALDRLITARRDRTGREILGEWAGHSRRLERMMADAERRVGPQASVAVFPLGGATYARAPAGA